MEDNSTLRIQKAYQTLLMISMFSVMMLFAGLTSAYIVSKGALGEKWDNIVLPNMFYVSTCMIIISSVFGYLAVNYCKSNNLPKLTQSLLLTIIFGLLFAVFQFLGWNDLVNEGKFLSGSNVASSYIYIFTITHLIHLVGGVIALMVTFFYARQKKYHSKNFNGLKLTIRFWHFLGFLWIYLFTFLILIN